MENFAQILDGLEKDVLDLVSDLEIQIRKRIAVSGRTAPKEPAKPFEPKWRGLRGALRWLWKGQSKDNPDYAHLYNQDGTKKEQSEKRPTLAEYLEEVRIIDGFADEIFVEEFGTTLAESFVDLSDLIVRFKANFRNIILKYKSLIKGSVSVPAEAPASPAKDATSPSEPPSSPASKDSASAATSEPPSATGSKPATISDKPAAPAANASDNPTEKENGDSASDQNDDGESDKETEKTEPSKAEKAEEERKSKSHSANIKRWFEEAMEAKRKGGDELKPKPDWLNPKGIVKAEKLPWVIAWMGTKSHKDLHKDEDVRAELASVLGGAFKDFVPQIAKKKSDSLVGYLRKKMPMASDEDFKKIVSDLYGSEYEGPGLSSQKSKKTTAPSTGKEEKEERQDGKPQEPDIQEIKVKTLSSLYDGMDKKEQILDAIENKIVERAYDMMESDADAEYFANWWKSFKRERMSESQETVESLVARINSGAMFDDILRNSEVSKNKPEKKIKLRTLMDMLKT